MFMILKGNKSKISLKRGVFNFWCKVNAIGLDDNTFAEESFYFIFLILYEQWDLVCVRAYLNELSTTLYMVGSMMGALLITPLSDKFGRRLVLLICLLLQAIIGSCVAFSPTYAVFTILRFIVGFFNMVRYNFKIFILYFHFILSVYKYSSSLLIPVHIHLPLAEPSYLHFSFQQTFSYLSISIS